MRALWGRLVGSPRALAAAGVGLVAVVALATTLIVVTTGDEGNAASSTTTPTPSSAGTSDAPKDKTKKKDVILPPNKDAYCPAFRKIQEGGLSTPGGDEEEGVDLAELSRTFDQLISRYDKAARVSPRSLRDNYAQALGYLRQGKKAADSQDVGLLKALVVNLEALNKSMEAIQTRSAKFCR